jgi:hypothetical protein
LNFDNLINSASKQTPEQFLASIMEEQQPSVSKRTFMSEGMRDFVKATITLLCDEYDSANIADWRIRAQFHARLRSRTRRLFYLTYGQNADRDSELRSNIREQVQSITGHDL